MPFFKIETNITLDETTQQAFLKKMTDFAVELLSKPQQYVMVSLHSDVSMMFGGSSEPTAYIELKSIGLPKERCDEFAKSVCEFTESELGLPPQRIFIDFWDIDRKLFGWNKKTF